MHRPCFPAVLDEIPPVSEQLVVCLGRPKPIPQLSKDSFLAPPQSLLAGTALFWRPLAGYMETTLENEDATRESTSRCLEHLEALAELL